MVSCIPILALVACAQAAIAADSPELAEFRKLLPAPGTVLIDAEPAARITVALADGCSTEVVAAAPAPGTPGGDARRITCARAFTPDYRLQAFSPATGAGIARGDVLALAVWMRCPSAVAGATGIARIRLQQSAAPWTAPIDTSTSLGSAWQAVYASGIADRDLPRGSVELAFHLGQQAQVIEIAAPVVIDCGPGVDCARLPTTRITWPGMAADAPWRAEAQRRIERYRKGVLAIVVTDAAGRPVPGVAIRVQERTRAFTIGSFVQFANPTALLAGSPDGERSRATFLRLFNRGTCPLYWADWGWPGRKDEFLAIGRWLRDHGIAVRGHVLVYPGFRFLPTALAGLAGDPPRLQRAILEHIREVAAATRDLGFREFDVTNELRDCVDLTGILGRQAVAEWYAEARRDLPTAKLALNENTILTNAGATTANQDTLLGWYRYLSDHGQAPDVLGFQCHFGESFTGPERLWSILDRFAQETAAELQITEFDINTLDEEAQAAYTRDFLTACFAHPRITGVTLWGFWEGDHWLPHAAFWRKDWSAKANAVVLERLLSKDWWTDATLTTDAHGCASLSAFLGRQHLSAVLGGRAVDADITLTDAGTTVTVPLHL